MLSMLTIACRLIEYETVLVAYARSEVCRWAKAAAAIPDPTLRALAIEAIAIDAGNAEAAAAFASMAPGRLRRAAVELLVVHQLLLDYVDMLGERVTAEQLQRGLAIGLALPAAIARPASRMDVDPLGDDGGYLAALLAACRTRLWECPSAAVVREHATVAAVRCAQGLAHAHTAGRSGAVLDLRRWSAAQDAVAYRWWEVAAGGNSNLALLALLAAATDPRTRRRDAADIASAYWPHVCILSTLLDSLVDYEHDAGGENFSFVSHYPDAAAARDGLIHATRLSLDAVEPLRHRHLHAMIVCGIAAYYAGSAAPGSLAGQIAPSVLAELAPAATPIVLALRARHRRGSPRSPGTAAQPLTARSSDRLLTRSRAPR
jgi:tetraprenyl-beta-curcumene synthase